MLCINYDRPSHLRFTWSESDGEDLFEQLLDDLRVQAQVSDQATTTPTLLNSQILVAQHRRQYRIEVVLPFTYVPSPVNLSEELVTDVVQDFYVENLLGVEINLLEIACQML